MQKFALGIDFGTESVRALVVEIETGKERSESVAAYASGVMDRELSTTGAPLPPEFALQDAMNYLDSMAVAVRGAIDQMGEGEIIGIGVDFTSSTPLPVREGKPLSVFFPDEPHAYVKLWKHHAAQTHADFINTHGPKELLARYGGAISSEWSLPKLLEFEAAAPELFEKADHWIEGGDWIVSTLIGRSHHPVRSRCQAGYKGLWSEECGYPSPQFLALCSTRVAARFEQLMSGTPLALGIEAGKLSDEWATRLGLNPGTSVATAAIDAHAGVPGSGVSRNGELLCVLGTSTCHMGLARELKYISGIAGAVRDGIIPGLVGYEAGQPAVGDLFSWMLKMQGKPLTPQEFGRLEAAAANVPPGSNGVLALDWWNGNRSVLMDSSLKGTWIGMRLTTTEADLYRSLIEATAYGTKLILETLIQGGAPVEHVVLSGGIAAKSPLLCQIYADVLDRPVDVVCSRQPVALGAAIYGAAAALGRNSSEMFGSLVAQMTAQIERKVTKPRHAKEYKGLYERYTRLQTLMHGFYRNER